jgi:serine/threonine protein kinase
LNKPSPFGKYYLLDRINVGGMAEVFKAKVMGVEGFERIVALKRILPHIAEDEEFITMFIDEAKIAVQLQHANIAQIFDLGKVDDAYFIALEYVHGRDMRGIFDDLHRKRQVMPTPQICFVIMQVCEGLDYAHNKRDAQGRALNLVHRDVSPQNILVGYEGEVKLIDFGIAKAAGKASKTQAGILKGKFGYMSPEQVRGLAIDRRSDIFALGIILYEMLTGERLFVGESDFSTLEKVRNVEIVPPSSINSAIPEQLERIVLKALAKDVEDRYQNALDLHDDLQAFLYTTGKFSSRKDLSAWMKRAFPSAAQPEEVVDVNSSVEIQDVDEVEPDTAELTPGAQAKAHHRRREEGLGWDDEELETSIYDRPGEEDSPRTQMSERAFESDDKTVAAAPSEAILAEMGEGFPAPSTFAEKAPTHRDQHLRQTMMGVGHTPPARPLPLPPASAARLTGPTMPTRPSTMMGQARPSGSMPVATPGPQAPLQMGRPILTPLGAPTAPDPHRQPAALRQTLMGMGVPSAPLPGGRISAGMAAPPSLFPPQPLVSMDQGQAYPSGPVLPGQGYGSRLTGGMDPATTTAAAMSLRSSSKIKYYLLFLVFMALGGGGAYMYLTRTGKVQIAVKPQDARVTVDGVVAQNGPPYVIERRPGIYHVAAARDGYISREQNVELHAAQVERVEMELEPSPDTGFELTSQPPGGLVWLDGQAFAVNESGKQATTNFRASRITPGRHVLEIKGDPKFKDWRQEIYQEPGQTLKIHAEREAIAPGARPATAAPAPGTKTTSAPAVAPPPAPAPAPVVAKPAPSPAPAASSDEGRKSGSSSRRSGGRGSSKTDDTFEDPFAAAPAKPAAAPAPAPSKPKSKTVSDDDLFATLGASPSASAGGSDQCIATIGSKPWAQVAIDGKATGKSTPLMDYSLPCGKHRITFTNPDLMIERNEIIILKAGQRFKKIFPLVDMDF